MKKWLHKIEVIIDKIIPFLLLLLLLIIIIDFFFKQIAEQYLFYVESADYFIIFIFLVDLIFKYVRVRNISKFVRTFWLDIIAVFPFFLVFRIFEAAAGLFSTSMSEGAASFQTILHEGLEVERGGAKLLEREGQVLSTVEKEGAKIAAETEKIAKISRSEKFARFLRPILRTPRFLKAVPFFEKPTGEHHVHEKKKS